MSASSLSSGKQCDNCPWHAEPGGYWLERGTAQAALSEVTTRLKQSLLQALKRKPDDELSAVVAVRALGKPVGNFRDLHSDAGVVSFRGVGCGTRPEQAPRDHLRPGSGMVASLSRSFSIELAAPKSKPFSLAMSIVVSTGSAPAGTHPHRGGGGGAPAGFAGCDPLQATGVQVMLETAAEDVSESKGRLVRISGSSQASGKVAPDHPDLKDLPLGPIELEVLDHFVRCVGSPAPHGKVTCSMCSSRLHKHSILAAADIISKACLKVMCHMRTPQRHWGCAPWKLEQGKLPSGDHKTWDDLLFESSKNAGHDYEANYRPDSCLFDDSGTEDASTALWEAVWRGDYEAVKSQLPDSADAASSLEQSSLLQQTRKFKVGFNPKILTGPVLILACMQYDQALQTRNANDKDAQRKVTDRRKIVVELLHAKADPNATYELFPCGKHNALTTAPICFVAKSPILLKILVRFGADLRNTSTLNYHIHNDLLREASWARNEDIARECKVLGVVQRVSKLQSWESDDGDAPDGESTAGGAADGQKVVSGGSGCYRWEWRRMAAILMMLREGEDRTVNKDRVVEMHLNIDTAETSKGWSPDYPPLQRDSCENRFTFLGRAIEMQMNSANEILLSDCVESYRIESQIAPILPMMNQDLFKSLFNADRSSHFTKKLSALLLNISTKMVERMHPTLLERMWTALAKNRMAKQSLKQMISSLAAAQEKQLSKPDSLIGNHDAVKDVVLTLVRHAPTAARILLDCFFLQAPNIEHPNRCPLSRKAVINKYDNLNTVATNTNNWTANNSDRSWHEELTRLESKSSKDDPSQFCNVRVVQLQGILHINFFVAMETLTYDDQVVLLQNCTTLRSVVVHTYGMWRWFRCVAGLECAIQLWALFMLCTMYSDASVSDAAALYWALFAAIALSNFVYDTLLLVLYILRSAFRSKGFHLTRTTVLLSVLDVVDHATSLFLISTTDMIWQPPAELAEGRIRNWMLAMVLLLKFVEVLGHLQRETALGKLLLPMTDAFADIKMISMLFLLFLTWAICAAILQAVQPRQGEDDASTKSIFYGAWVNLIVGEPVMLDTDEYEQRMEQFGVISMFHLIFQVGLLNMLLATTIETYDKMREGSVGRQARTKMVVCLHWLIEQKSLQWLCSKVLLHIGRVSHGREQPYKCWGLGAKHAALGAVCALFLLAGICVPALLSPGWLPGWLPLWELELLVLTPFLFCCRFACMLWSSVSSSSDHDFSEDQAFLWVCLPEETGDEAPREWEESREQRTGRERQEGLERRMDEMQGNIRDLLKLTKDAQPIPVMIN